MANRWGENWKQWQIFFSWAPKSLWTVTAAIKLKDTPFEKSYDKSRQCIKKQRHHFADRGKAVVFPVVMYSCENWTIKKAEHWRTDAFEMCWRRLLSVPWTARRPDQSVLKEINPEYSLEGLMLKLKLQYFGYLMWRAYWLEKTDSGKDWGQEEKGATEDEMVG